MTRSFALAPPALAATLLFAACVNLAQPPWGQASSAGGTGGSSTAAGGGSGGGSGVSGGGGTSGGATTGGAGGLSATGGTTTVVTGGTAGSVAPDAGSVGGATVPADGGIDVPYSPDVSPPADTGGAGGGGGSGGSSAGGSGGTAGQGGAAGGSTPVGGSAVPDAAVAGSGGGSGGASSSGATGGGGATGGAGGSASTATGGAAVTCTPVPKSTGGISCPGGFCTVGAYSGYDFTLVDKSGKSSVCAPAGSLCGAGTVGVQDPPNYTVWGAGFGFNLSPLTTASTIEPVQLTGSGVTVTLSSLPTGGATARVQVTVGTAQYCAVMTKATQTIPWTSFNLTCWAPTAAGALTGPPNASNIQFEAASGTTAGAFDFCVTALSFQ